MNTKNENSDKVMQLIEEKEALQLRYDNLACKISPLLGQLQHVHNQLIPARQKISSYESARDPKYYVSELKTARKDLDSLLKDEAKYEAEIQQLEDDLHELHSQISQIENTASVEEIKNFILRISYAESNVKKIEDLIGQQQDIVDGLGDDSEDKLADLQNKRSSVLANIALDEADETDLQKVDDEISTLVSESSKNHFKDAPISRNAKQVIQGLRPKLDEARSQLLKLKTYLPKMLEAFLLGQAEQAGKQYLKHAQALYQEFKRMKSIEDIRTKHRLNNELAFFEPNYMDLLTIPSVRLKCFEKADLHYPERHLLFSVSSYPKRMNEEYIQALHQEYKKYESLGLSEALSMVSDR